MNARFYAFSQAFKGAQTWARPGKLGARPRIIQFVYRSCQNKFSTSSLLRQIQEASKKAATGATGAVKPGRGVVDKKQQFPEKLVIYKAGEKRSSFISFWKATAIFQFGIVAVFLAPILYHNENQPDPNIRLLQAVGLTLAGAIPFCLMSYLTTPFVKRISIQLPAYARLSRSHLDHFTTHLPPETKLEFTTLRAFPLERSTGVFLFELQALPAQWWRFANIERAKTQEWTRRHKMKGFWSKVWEVMNEPRFKFYVKEGKVYTIKTGVPGVWENIVRQIKSQTVSKDGKVLGLKEKVKTKGEVTKSVERLRRQTMRRER